MTKKRSSSSGTVKRLISCVNLLVNMISMCFKVPTCKESIFTLVADVIICFACVCVFHTSLKVNSEGKYDSTIRTGRGFPVNSTVTCWDTRWRKGVGTSEAVKRIISCVNLLVNLKSLCLKTPTCKGSLVTLVAKVILC